MEVKDDILKEISSVMLWDVDYGIQIKKILFKFMDNNKFENKYTTLKYIMDNTHGHLNPKMVLDIIKDYNEI